MLLHYIASMMTKTISDDDSHYPMKNEADTNVISPDNESSILCKRRNAMRDHILEEVVRVRMEDTIGKDAANDMLVCTICKKPFFLNELEVLTHKMENHLVCESCVCDVLEAVRNLRYEALVKAGDKQESVSCSECSMDDQ